jgi:hypothetical protein
VLFWMSQLGWTYVMAVQAMSTVPDPGHREGQELNWWGMLSAGYEIIRLPEQLRDPDWRLAGKPWRVLRHGDLRIPVFKRRARSRENAENLGKQHYVRMTAYCHLLEKCENAASPYGIILFGDSYHGVTVPNTAGRRRVMEDSLLEARRVLIKRDGPVNEQKCVRCPFNSPRDATMPDCGDRFDWSPPARRARRFLGDLDSTESNDI